MDKELCILITISRMGYITICLYEKRSCIYVISYGLILGDYG